MAKPTVFNPDKANVGLFCEVFPPVMDGVSVCMENYAYWLQKKVGGVAVVTPHVPKADYSVHEYKVFDYMSIPVPKRRPYMTGIAAFDPTYLAKIATTRFKIVHAHTPFSAGSAALSISRAQRIPLVATFHSKYRDDFSKILPKLVVDMMIDSVVDFFERADLVWVPQESVIDVIREYGYKGHVEVMDNGSDLVADYPEKYFVEARQRLGIAPEEFVLLFVGQHVWQKNPQLTIEALSRLEDVPFKMFFVGNGYAAEEMKAMVSEKGLDGKVTFVGTITDRAKIVDYYAASDLFVFPSLYDNAPLVVREAAALHTPSVMAIGSTAATILQDGENGFLVENDPDKLAQLLRELIHDPERVHRVGVQASKTIVRSWEDCVEEVIDRYNALLRSRGLPLIERPA
ncbi:MAG: glycosyltransferase [Bacteroidales bacterium]|nr:glycosyltransferase [Bacteroidales bacterium]MDY6444416.1 glycosyltransferase [Bacteroidales bacterium]